MKSQNTTYIAFIILSSALFSGCAVKENFKNFVVGFAHKIEQVANTDYENEKLRHQVAVLSAENARLKNKLAKAMESERAQRVHANSLHEAGSEAGRVEASLVPELFESHHATEHKSEHHAQARESFHKPVADPHADHNTDHNSERQPASDHHSPAAHAAPEHHATPEHHDASKHEVDHHSSDAHHAENPHAAATHDAHHAEVATAGHSQVSHGEVNAMTILSAPPKKVYEEANRAFSKNDFHRAARGFVALASNKENTRFATAEVNYFAGVSLYQLKNYKAALKYLQNAQVLAESEKKSALSPKILMWTALCQKNLGEAQKSKQTVQRLVERYPASAEARRVH